MMTLRPWMAALLVLAPLRAGFAQAQTLSVGVATETSSIDPHYSITNPNVSLNRHIYDPLVRQDERQRLTPGLAASWQAVSDTEWEFRLRADVHFHNGQPLTADDVAFSLTRAGTLPNTTAGFGIMTRQISAMRIVDPLTIRLSTAAPFPLMGEHLSAVAILSRAATEGMETKDFNTGRAAIGTGPFRFVAWTNGDAVRLARNDGWWGGALTWQAVTVRPIPDAAARVAALLSGAVDMIDQVPANALAPLKARPDIVLSETLSNRVVFLLINHASGPSLYAKAADGGPLADNPLRDLRVRRAMSLAINRAAITERVLENSAQPAAQLLPAGHAGVSDRLSPDAHDPNAARALLAEAGYPQGFALVMQMAAGRNVGDQQIAEAIAQMLARVGIIVTIESMPNSMFATRMGKGEFLVMLRSWGTETGEVSMAIRSLFATRDIATGWGTFNRGGYSNPALDTALRDALMIFDPQQRHARLQQVTELAMADLPLIPLHFQAASWGLRKGLAYTARADNYTFAFDVRSVDMRPVGAR